MSSFLSPHQFGLLRGGEQNAATQGKKLPEIADMLYKAEPQFMGKLENDVRSQGFTDPVVVSQHTSGSLDIENGQHRAAVAHRLGTPLPYQLMGSTSGWRTQGDHDRNSYWEDDARSPEEAEMRDRMALGDDY